MLNKNKFPKFNPDAYTIIASSDLVVYAIYYLQHHGIDITHEDIISACFKLFPKKFSLKKYPQWPDSAMINRRWSDCRSKGYIAAKTDSGFKLTAKGSRHAEKVAKALGVAIPKKVKSPLVKKVSGTPVMKAQLAPAKKKLSIPVLEVPKVKQEHKAEPKQKAKPVVTPAPVAKAKSSRAKQVKKILTRPARKVFAAPVIKAPKARQERKAETKQKAKPVVTPVPVARTKSLRAKQTKKTPTKPARKALPAPVKEIPKIRQEKKAKITQKTKAIVPPAPVAKAKPSRAKQVKKILTRPARKVFAAPVIKAPKARREQKAEVKLKTKATPPVAKAKPSHTKQEKKTQPPAKILPPSQPVQPLKTRPKKPAKDARPIWKEGTSLPAPVVIPQEAKVRAGKFVRMMETSDAYIHYKKNGTNSGISEFDFRSLLLCTMESTPETLARNMELFKGYADIHNRRDLIAFLVFCNDKFSYLFLPQKKIIRKIR
jgi:hypothetical protein